MAKQINEEQLDLFPVKPEITGLGITKFETKGAEVIGTVMGVTNVHDIALLTDDCWKIAVAEWLTRLCKGDSHEARNLINLAWSRLQEQESEGFASDSQH